MMSTYEFDKRYQNNKYGLCGERDETTKQEKWICRIVGVTVSAEYVWKNVKYH